MGRWKKFKYTFLLLLVIGYVPIYFTLTKSPGNHLIPKDTKLILLATKRWGERDWNLPDDRYEKNILPLGVDAGVKVDSNSVKNCLVTADVNYVKDFSQFDALIFHHFETWYWMWFYYIGKVTPRQKTVFFTHESPDTYSIGKHWNDYFRNFFSTTMTYRDDSTLVLKYYHTIRKAGVAQGSGVPPPAVDLASLTEPTRKLASRPKLVYWMVSKCNPSSLRERYAFELKKHIDVDIYGKCTNTNFDVSALRHSTSFTSASKTLSAKTTSRKNYSDHCKKMSSPLFWEVPIIPKKPHLTHSLMSGIFHLPKNWQHT